MFGKQFKLFTLFGFSVKVDLSWLVIAVLITYSLAEGLFPTFLKGLPKATYWWMGLAGALGLFGSIVVHEFAHSLVARMYGIHMRGITLFIFGGVAEMADEPPSAVAEFWVAIAGPVASVLIALGSAGLATAAMAAGSPSPIYAILWFVAFMNGSLVVFNLLPAFPLDGGRVLRALLWQLRGNLRWATRITSRIGAGFGLLLIVAGVISVLRGNAIGGVWWCLLGLFLRSAALSSYQQLLVRRVLEGEPVSRLMRTEVQTVPPELSLQELVDDYIYQHHFKMFPVVDGGRLVGCVTTRRVKEVPRDEWAGQTVAELAEPCSPENTISPDADAMEALKTMNRSGISRMMVVEGDQLRGIISLREMMKLISLKLELEDRNS